MSSKAGKTHFFEDLSVGMEASYARTVQESDLQSFADISGDDNPIHLNEDYAAATPFKRRIAPGMLSASYISAVLGSKFPGYGTIYISQTLNFRAPVHIGDEVTATVRITELIEAKKRAVLSCACTVDGEVVLEGEAVIKIPSRDAG
jgi:3-hydroxybutyryl-CoA dehydratase